MLAGSRVSEIMYSTYEYKQDEFLKKCLKQSQTNNKFLGQLDAKLNIL